MLVTGGAKRVGAAIARRLHREGANLMLHYRGSEREAKALRAELNAARAGFRRAGAGRSARCRQGLPEIVRNTVGTLRAARRAGQQRFRPSFPRRSAR